LFFRNGNASERKEFCTTSKPAAAAFLLNIIYILSTSARCRRKILLATIFADPIDAFQHDLEQTESIGPVEAEENICRIPISNQWEKRSRNCEKF
jgi:hypothetical protein